MELFNLKWLEGDSINAVSFDKNVSSWSITFKSGASLYVECLWRLLENDILCSTSSDHGHLFGNDKPFDGVAALTEMKKYTISNVSVREGTTDIIIKFSKLFILEIISNSAGFEPWNVTHPKSGRIISSGCELHKT